MSVIHNKPKLFTLLFLSSIAVASVSCAAPEKRGRHQGPPAEAIEACADLSQGDACSFLGRRDEEISGSCAVVSDDELACAPEGGPSGQRRPPER